jgi:two-component system cell cycle response regulator DivK
LNGWEVAKRIRQKPEFSEMTIVAYTAHALIGDELKAKASGCDDYLSKPCLPKDVVKKVAYWLAKKQAVHAAGMKS